MFSGPHCGRTFNEEAPSARRASGWTPKSGRSRPGSDTSPSASEPLVVKAVKRRGDVCCAVFFLLKNCVAHFGRCLENPPLAEKGSYLVVFWIKSRAASAFSDWGWLDLQNSLETS